MASWSRTGNTKANNGHLMTRRTQSNLDLAMHSEAFASAKCKRFAAFARTRGHSEWADLLAGVADEARIGHFAAEIQSAGLITDDLDNLRDILRDLQYQVERYRQFVQEAEQDGDSEVAALFKIVASDDETYIRQLDAALEQHKSEP